MNDPNRGSSRESINIHSFGDVTNDQTSAGAKHRGKADHPGAAGRDPAGKPRAGNAFGAS